MSQSRTPRHIRSTCDGHWEWFFSQGQPPYRITGKYLFFSPDRELLVSIAIEEIESGAYHVAKTQMLGKSHSEDYVLCLYYRDDSKKRELATKYRNHAIIKYRYWKSDEATRRGEYSEQFMGSLDPVDRRRFFEQGGDTSGDSDHLA